jgi:hypothetical protein
MALLCSRIILFFCNSPNITLFDGQIRSKHRNHKLFVGSAFYSLARVVGGFGLCWHDAHVHQVTSTTDKSRGENFRVAGEQGLTGSIRQLSPTRAASISFALVGCGLIASYAAGQAVSLWISGAIFFASVAAVLSFSIAGQFGVMPFMVYAVTALPFVHMIPYLFFDWGLPAPREAWKPGDLTIWGLATNPYMFDLETIKLTAELGAAGVSGFLAGAFGAYYVSAKLWATSKFVAVKTLNPYWFIALLAAALIASNLAAPERTIFEAAYVGAGAQSEALKFGSLGLVSYLLLILCFADAIFDGERRTAFCKLFALVVSIAYVVIWLQFARGDRESVPVVLACAIMFWRWGAPRFAQGQLKIAALRALAVALVALVMASGFVLQAVRPNLEGKKLSDVAGIAKRTFADPKPVGSALSVPVSPPSPDRPLPGSRGALFDKIDRYIPKGTWSAVLLTPLSVAGDSLREALPLKLGQTYLDFILSMPPGFIASRLGYQRPIDADHGPAHEMRYGQGGTHAVVVPFVNFRMVGVVLIFTLWGWLFVTLERRTSDISPPRTIPKVAAYGAICAIIPQWIWYGEKILITAFLIWVGISVCYVVATRSSRGAVAALT